jgi:hypothetical protein
MAASTVSTVGDLLIRSYTRQDWFVPFERSMTKFLDSIEDFPNEEPLGVGRYFGIRLKDAHSTGGIAESGELPTLRQPQIVQGIVIAVQIAASCGWSELLLSVGTKGGSIGPDVISDHVEMTTRNLMSHINRVTVAGHGTGRMGVVDGAVTTSASVVCRNPEHILQFRPGMTIDAYDTDTGGTKQGSTMTIASIDFENRTLKMAATTNLTDGWSLFQAVTSADSDYPPAPNGLRGIADNGALGASTKFGLSTTTYPGLLATVLSVTGTQAYSQKLMRKAINRVFFETGLEPSEAWTNKGIIGEHLSLTQKDTVYDMGTGTKTPSYRIGHDEKQIGINFNGRFIPYNYDGDFPGREIVFVTKDLFRRHVVRPASWIGDGTGADGSSSPVLMQLPGTSNYTLAKVAGMLWAGNIAHKMPKSLVSVRSIADEEICGDS